MDTFMKLKIVLLFSVKSELGQFLVIPIEFMSYFFNMSVNIVFTLKSMHYVFYFMWEKSLFSLFCPQMFHIFCQSHFFLDVRGKGLPQQAEVAQGVPGRLRPRIFLTFGTTRVLGLQPYAPAAFTPREIPGTHF